jgi:hypothetical protein
VFLPARHLNNRTFRRHPPRPASLLFQAKYSFLFVPRNEYFRHRDSSPRQELSVSPFVSRKRILLLAGDTCLVPMGQLLTPISNQKSTI